MSIISTHDLFRLNFCIDFSKFSALETRDCIAWFSVRGLASNPVAACVLRARDLNRRGNAEAGVVLCRANNSLIRDSNSLFGRNFSLFH